MHAVPSSKLEFCTRTRPSAAQSGCTARSGKIVVKQTISDGLRVITTGDQISVVVTAAVPSLTFRDVLPITRDALWEV